MALYKSIIIIIIIIIISITIIIIYVVTEIRFVDVNVLEVGKDLVKIEMFELIKQEVEAILMQLHVRPLYLMYLTVSSHRHRVTVITITLNNALHYWTNRLYQTVG